MSQSISPIEELIKKKVRTIYDKFKNDPNKIDIYINTLKSVLTEEINTIKNTNSMFDPPFNPFKITKIQDIDVIVQFHPRSSIGADGKLQVLNNKFIIKIDENLQFSLKGYRLRTTVAHELMHGFFYYLENNKLIKLGSGPLIKKQIYAQENLCNYLAREFLVPSNSLHKSMEKKKQLTQATIQNIDYFKSKYMVSSDIIAWRLIKDLELWDTIYAKYTQKKLIFKPANWLKYKRNKLYSRIHLPRSIPSGKKYWHEIISSTIEKTMENDQTYRKISHKDHNYVIESRVDSINPLSVIILLRSTR